MDRDVEGGTGPGSARSREQGEGRGRDVEERGGDGGQHRREGVESGYSTQVGDVLNALLISSCC